MLGQFPRRAKINGIKYKIYTVLKCKLKTYEAFHKKEFI